MSTSLPALGVGLTYCSAIEPLLQAEVGLVDVLEVEPQTLWSYSSRTGSYRVDDARLERLASFPCSTLLHSVGCPVGGVRGPDPTQLRLLSHAAELLRVPWMSEHLSFNRAGGPAGEFNTAFLLPPRQTAEGVATAIRSVGCMARAVPVPLAIETGVSYLKPRDDELLDGDFVAQVASGADCGILLDLHNLWTNERNGRQSIAEFMSQIPLDRVWEVHLGGGSAHRGYWIDSHSDVMPKPLVDLAQAVIAQLPKLRAIIYEVFPAFLPDVGLDGVRSQLEILHDIWRHRTTQSQDTATGRPAPNSLTHVVSAGQPTPCEWEDTLGALTVGRAAPGALGGDLSADPGVALIQELVEEFRASMIVSTLPLTARLLMLAKGEAAFRDLLSAFWRCKPPELFASAEGEAFAAFLAGLELDVPYLAEVVRYEQALLSTLLDRESRVVRFEHDPLVLLRALNEARLPTELPVGWYEIELTDTSEANVPGQSLAVH